MIPSTRRFIALAAATLLPGCAGTQAVGTRQPPPEHIVVTTMQAENGGNAAANPHLQPPGGPIQPAETPATAGYRAALARAHIGMEVPFTGNADQDFVGNMVPHHQAAIDLAEIELRYGSDPTIRRIAAEIIRNQERENNAMNAWLRRHPVRQ